MKPQERRPPPCQSPLSSGAVALDAGPKPRERPASPASRPHSAVPTEILTGCHVMSVSEMVSRMQTFSSLCPKGTCGLGTEVPSPCCVESITQPIKEMPLVPSTGSCCLTLGDLLPRPAAEDTGVLSERKVSPPLLVALRWHHYTLILSGSERLFFCHLNETLLLVSDNKHEVFVLLCFIKDIF